MNPSLFLALLDAKRGPKASAAKLLKERKIRKPCMTKRYFEVKTTSAKGIGKYFEYCG